MNILSSRHGGLLPRCEAFTSIFDLHGDGVLRHDEFLDFARPHTERAVTCRHLGPGVGTGSCAS